MTTRSVRQLPPAGTDDKRFMAEVVNGGLEQTEGLDTRVTALEAVAHREVLTTNRTYYVRTDGSNSNDGLTDSSGGAFLTIGYALSNVVATLDIGSYVATVKVKSGTFGGFTLSGPFVVTGSGYVVVEGDTSTPSNVLINSQITLNSAAKIRLGGAKMTSAGSCIVLNNASDLTISAGIEFGAATLHHVVVDSRSAFNLGPSISYTVSGGASTHALVQNGAYYYNAGNTITIAGTPTFSDTWLRVQLLSIATVNANSITGTITGTQYNIGSNAVFGLYGGSIPGTGNANDGTAVVV